MPSNKPVACHTARRGEKLSRSQSVSEGAHVTLDGSVCLGQNLSYAWTQVGGPSVSLVGANTANPSFTAPMLPGGFGSQTLSFQLSVSDGTSSSSAVVNVIVVNVNHAPVSDAGAPVLVQEGSPVTLNGGNSYDPDGDPIAYSWTQISGPTVTLSSLNSAATSFMAPLIGGAPNNSVDLIFALTTSDGALSNSSAVTVTVQRVNHPPVADAGTGQTVRPGATVTLNGSLSSDPDSDPLQFMWTQLSGPTVSLTGASTSTPSFTAPNVFSPTTLVFRLAVSDGLAASVPSDVPVTVTNNTPVCSAATASPSVLWPPNHALVPIKIVGVTDPDNDQLSLTITGVTQDEPVNGTGDGDTSPDAVIQGSGLLLRAERSGAGDGRVYFISFAAADNQGGSCTGAVQVTVPKNMSKSGAAIDSGTRYQSTAP